MSTTLSLSPEQIAARIFPGSRVLVFGEPGTGKSTLTSHLAEVLAARGHACACIAADPGSPAFGVPGAVNLARWRHGGWRYEQSEALCTLNAGRFRLPLVAAVRRIARRPVPEILLVDAPGVARGVAGSETLTALVDAADIGIILTLVREEKEPPLINELTAADCELIVIRPSLQAVDPGKKNRAVRRTRLWDAYLENGIHLRIRVPRELLVGTPPPSGAEAAMNGRQIAFLRKGKTLAMGEIMETESDLYRVRTILFRETPDRFLVRDACREDSGLLRTCRPQAERGAFPPPGSTAGMPGKGKEVPYPVVHIGDSTCTLMNGVFGDPLLHLRLHNKKRSLLFDLGEGGRLPARLAHQVSDVFITHAHIDHICGFLWLLRSRIGFPRPCRIYGPPDLADRIFSLVNGILWDRIGEEGPCFEVYELKGDMIHGYSIKAGNRQKRELGNRRARDGILVADADCTVAAAILSHGPVPVLAYRLTLPVKYNVRRDILAERKLPPGPWLGLLKRHIAAGDQQATVILPGGRTASAGVLADKLLKKTPPLKIVYATDLSDTRENRGKLTLLAAEAHAFFCEAAFLEVDGEYAHLSGHLTARACGEIAAEGSVEQLIPFHFSRRYEKKWQRVYAEVGRYAGPAKIPGGQAET
jgi:ribonuclease BN (tRNA processing enzyme)